LQSYGAVNFVRFFSGPHCIRRSWRHFSNGMCGNPSIFLRYPVRHFEFLHFQFVHFQRPIPLLHYLAKHRNTKIMFSPLNIAQMKIVCYRCIKTSFIRPTFRVRHSRGEMYIGHSHMCVCVSVCPSPHSHTAARTPM